jgi:hypothetical protein
MRYAARSIAKALFCRDPANVAAASNDASNTGDRRFAWRGDR